MAAADLIPILTSLLERGKTFSNSGPGIESNNKVQATLGGREGAALSRSEELAALLPDGAPFSTTEPPRYLRLPDVDEGGSRMSPLVYFDGDLSSAKPYMRFQVVLVVHGKKATSDAKTLALRFETPERDATGDGKHDYYHSQLCVSLRRGEGTDTLALPIEPDWFPTSHPAWPMDAETPVELLVCLILSLYGKVGGSEIIRDAGESDGRDFFQELLGAMRTKFGQKPGSTKGISAKKKKRVSKKRRRKR